MGAPTGRSSIEQISWHYGAQAVVVSIDPRRVWVADPAECPHATVRSSRTGALRQGSAATWARGNRREMMRKRSADLMWRQLRFLKCYPDSVEQEVTFPRQMLHGRMSRRQACRGCRAAGRAALLVAVHGEGRAGGARCGRRGAGARGGGFGRWGAHAELHRPGRHQPGACRAQGVSPWSVRATGYSGSFEEHHFRSANYVFPPRRHLQQQAGPNTIGRIAGPSHWKCASW